MAGERAGKPLLMGEREKIGGGQVICTEWSGGGQLEAAGDRGVGDRCWRWRARGQGMIRWVLGARGQRIQDGEGMQGGCCSYVLCGQARGPLSCDSFRPATGLGGGSLF